LGGRKWGRGTVRKEDFRAAVRPGGQKEAVGSGLNQKVGGHLRALQVGTCDWIGSGWQKKTRAEWKGSIIPPPPLTFFVGDKLAGGPF